MCMPQRVNLHRVQRSDTYIHTYMQQVNALTTELRQRLSDAEAEKENFNTHTYMHRYIHQVNALTTRLRHLPSYE